MGEMEGCEHAAAYKSDWDCPPIGNSMLVCRDGGHSWTQVGPPRPARAMAVAESVANHHFGVRSGLDHRHLRRPCAFFPTW